MAASRSRRDHAGAKMSGLPDKEEEVDDFNKTTCGSFGDVGDDHSPAEEDHDVNSDFSIDDNDEACQSGSLAILFFLADYQGSLPSLPGVVNDGKELTRVLKKYKKIVFNCSSNVIEDLKDISKYYKNKEFERIHFHFSGKIYR